MKGIIFISFLLLTFTARTQSEPLQSQYMYNAVALNPAYTGSEDAFSIVGSFRAQWLGFPGAPLTQSLTAHAPLKGMKASIGGQFFADQIGVTRRTGVYGTYSYRIPFEKSTFVFGASGGVSLIKSFYSELQGNDLDDLTAINDSPLGIMPDFSFGMHYYTKKFFVSFSVPRFLSHNYDGMKFNVSNNFRNYNFILGGGYLFQSKKGVEVKPSFLAKYRADSKFQIDLNLMVKLNRALELGLSYRTSEAAILLAKFNLTEQFSFMYSFGAPLSPIIKNSYGSHEIGIKYNFLYKTVMTSPRFLGF